MKGIQLDVQQQTNGFICTRQGVPVFTFQEMNGLDGRTAVTIDCL